MQRFSRFERFPILLLAALLIAALSAAVLKSHLPQRMGVYGSQHLHADFLVQIDDAPIDFSATRYQSTNESPHSPIIHLHDGNGYVVHSHATGGTWGMFFQSIGFSLNATCFTTDARTSYCTNATHVLSIRVDGRSRPQLAQWEIRDLERVLIAYLPAEEIDKLNKLHKLQQAVSDEACIHSGKCPERGQAPVESGCSAAGDCIAPQKSIEENHE